VALRQVVHLRTAFGAAARATFVALAFLALLATPAAAQPSESAPVEPPPGPPATLPEETPVQLQAPSEVLRAGNAAATAGDWGTVSQLVDPLLGGQLAEADLAEAHRLAGLASFFQGRREQAERHFLAYLRIDLDAQLDPSLYPAEAVIFFNDVKARHNAELRARRPKGKRYWVLNLLPPGGQFQNGQRTKGFVVGGLLAGFAIAHGTSYLLLRRWCTRTTGMNGGSGLTCDDGGDHYASAGTMRTLNAVSGVGLILTYAYGVIDGAVVYKRRTRERAVQPFITTSRDSGFIGVAGQF